MAVPPSLPPRTQLERNRFRYHLPLSTLYPRRFSTFLHLIPSPTAPSLVAPLIKCEIPLGVLSPFISFQRSSPSCLLIPRLGGERERYIYISVSLLTALSYSSTRSSLSSLVSARSEARGARLYVDIASLLTGAKDVYDICLTLIGKCFEHSLSLCFFLLRSGGAVN